MHIFICTFIFFLFVISTSVVAQSNNDDLYPGASQEATWAEEDFIPFKGDFNDDEIVDIFLQPKRPAGEFMVFLGKLINGEVKYFNGDVVTYPAYTEDGSVDLSAFFVDIVLGQFSGSSSLDLLAFEKGGTAMYYIEGQPDGFALSKLTPLTNTLNFPFSSHSEYYSIHTGHLNTDGFSDIIAISTERNVDGMRLHHYVVETDNPAYAMVAAGDTMPPEQDNHTISVLMTHRIENKKDIKSRRIGDVFVADFNGDGLDDIFIQGDKKGHSHYYVPGGSASLMDWDSVIEYQRNDFDLNWSKKSATLQLDDANGDGLPELVRYSKARRPDALVYFSPASQQVTPLTQGAAGLGLTSTTQHTMTSITQTAPVTFNVTAHEAGSAVLMNWDKGNHDYVEIEKEVGNDWVTVYGGADSGFVDVDVMDGAITYRLTACHTLILPKYCQDAIYHTVIVDTPITYTHPRKEDATIMSILSSLQMVNTSQTLRIPPSTPIIQSTPISVGANMPYTVSWSESKWDNHSSDILESYYELHGEMKGFLRRIDRYTLRNENNHFYDERKNDVGTYGYVVRACHLYDNETPDDKDNTTECSGWSPRVGDWIVGGVPMKPAFIYGPATAEAGKDYRLHWDDSPTATYFVVEGENRGEIVTTLCDPAARYQCLETVRNNAEGTYNYRVKACNDNGCSDFSANIWPHVDVRSATGNVPPTINSVETWNAIYETGEGNDKVYVTDHNHPASIRLIASDSDKDILRYQWRQTGSNAAAYPISGIIDDGNTFYFQTPDLTDDATLQITVTVMDMINQSVTKTFDIEVNSRPTASSTVFSFSNNEKLPSTARMNLSLRGISDNEQDNISLVRTFIRDEDTLHIVTPFFNMALSNNNTQADYTYPTLASLKTQYNLQPNRVYRLVAQAADDRSMGGDPKGIRAYSHWYNKFFTINDKPVVTSKTRPEVLTGDTYTFTLHDLTITDVDDTEHWLTVKPGADYTVENNTITVNPNVTADTIAVNLAIADSTETTDHPFVIDVKQPGSNRQVIFIHTDLLGSPVAETNENGEVQQ